MATISERISSLAQAMGTALRNTNLQLAQRATVDQVAAVQAQASTDASTKANAVAASIAAVYLPKWQPNTAYGTGALAVNPSGQIIRRKADGTSGATYDPTAWDVVAGGGVQTVAGRSGDVLLSKNDVGLGNVSNTADADKPISTVQQNALNAKADLVGGLIPTSQIPALALNTVVPVASRSAMLALTSAQVQPGDVAVDTSSGATRGSYMLLGTDPSQIANWVLLTAPTDLVTSVNGQTGAVTLGKADIGLGSVDNTADSAKPISTAQQTALDLKAPIASPTFTGNPKAPTAAAGDSSTVLATTAFAQGAAASAAASAVRSADYVISLNGGTISANPRTGSGLTAYSGDAASQTSTVIQSAINALTPSGGGSGSAGGHIHIARGLYFLNAELTINGWEGTVNNPSSQLMISGDGYSSEFAQNNSGQNGIVVKNSAAFVLRDIRLYNGSNAKSCLLLDNTGATTEVSSNNSVIDNVNMTSASTSYPTAYLKNFFGLQVLSAQISSSGYHGLVLENNSANSTNYGNSYFGHLNLGAGGFWLGNYAGLVCQSVNSGTLNLLTFANVNNVAQNYYGIYAKGLAYSTFEFVDLENSTKPIYFDGTAVTAETRHNWVRSGYLLANGNGAAITTAAATGGNSFEVFVEGSATTVPVSDGSTGRPVNKYDLIVRNSTMAGLVSISQSANTPLRIRDQNGNVTLAGPSAPTANIQVFEASGTWTKPPRVTSVQVLAVAGGGGGGSGRRTPSGTAASGGGGGGGGGIADRTLSAASLPATVAVTVGSGGNGGAAVGTDATNGNNGGSGNPSMFGSFVRANAATGGSGGGTGTASAGSGGLAQLGGGGGATGSAGGAGSAGGTSALGPAGGGSGGGLATSPSSLAGGNSGFSVDTNSAAAGGAAGGGAGAGGGSQGTGIVISSPGGGGGGSNASGAGGAGGVGGSYGGGGGGGGASLNGNNSGPGGAGAAGVVVVISW